VIKEIVLGETDMPGNNERPAFRRINEFARINFDALLGQPPVGNPWIIEEVGRAMIGGEKPHKHSVDNGPEVWDKMLTAVKEIYEPEMAIVAGGAVRDYVLGLQPKDIDIFIHLKEELPYATLVDLANQLGWNNIQDVGNKYGKSRQSLGHVQFVIKANVFSYSVDLCFTTAPSPEELIKAFDWNICQHWYDGQVNSTMAAKLDVKKNQWTPVRTPDGASKEHFDRVNKRHGGNYKLNLGEPWYHQFTGKEKIK
jgi:hypothetical protein